jgi:hypothetical protein
MVTIEELKEELERDFQSRRQRHATDLLDQSQVAR